mmetsp:Transcript_2499/g.5552  ORF Transcript_2499/g.5552 Transcript_2499/m.5552 type:complete len:247 (-) Transcript_2499:207-947(-)
MDSAAAAQASYTANLHADSSSVAGFPLNSWMAARIPGSGLFPAHPPAAASAADLSPASRRLTKDLTSSSSEILDETVLKCVFAFTDACDHPPESAPFSRITESCPTCFCTPRPRFSPFIAMEWHLARALCTLRICSALLCTLPFSSSDNLPWCNCAILAAHRGLTPPFPSSDSLLARRTLSSSIKSATLLLRPLPSAAAAGSGPWTGRASGLISLTRCALTATWAAGVMGAPASSCERRRCPCDSS